MSYRSLVQTSGFIREPLQNGVGRYLCQLQRVVIKFCKSHGGSSGVRQFIETDLLQFAKQNPGIVVYLKPRRHRSPVLSAEYLNGEKHFIGCHNYTRDEVNKWLEYLRTVSGYPIIRLRKMLHTDHPSIQGVWTPFTNKDSSLNVTQFPNKDLSEVPHQQPTATEQLLEMFQRQKEKAN